MPGEALASDRANPFPVDTPGEFRALGRLAPGHALRRFWSLEPDMRFLNHGSFGATPRFVLAAQDHWRAQLERQPVRFMLEELPGHLRAAANRLAAFVGSVGERIVFVDNATAGVNAVLRSLPWRKDDGIVVASHAYPAIRNTVAFVASRYGLEVRAAAIPFPTSSPSAIVEAYLAAVDEHTRLVIVDHVFSPLALVAPVREIVDRCHALGVAVLVDAAHAPGMLPLALDDLGADWTTGNCHKWLLAPKGCAFLHLGEGPGRSWPLRPTVISNFHGQGSVAEFDWQGTRDCSAWLATGAAIDFVEAFGAARYRSELAELAMDAAAAICRRWRVDPPAPAAMFAAMVTLPLPERCQVPTPTPEQARRWHDHLWQEHRIEVPVLVIENRLWVRISAQIYNQIDDYLALADAVAEAPDTPG